VCGVLYFFVVDFTPTPAHQHAGLRTLLNLVLVFRLLRLLKLLAVFSPTKKVLWTLQRVGPSMGRLLFIIVTVFYAFAIVGVDLFQPMAGPTGYTEQLTFSSFPAAMLSLFEVSMLSSWPMVMGAAVNYTTKWAEVFFYTFRVITVMLLLPVFIGFIVESFVSNYTQVEAEFKKEQHEVLERYRAWQAERQHRRERRIKRERSKLVDPGSPGSLEGGLSRTPALVLQGQGQSSSAREQGATGDASSRQQEPRTVSGDGEGDSFSDEDDDDDRSQDFFTYVEEAAVEMAIKRRTSDVNYIMFDVGSALQQADYEKMQSEYRAQVAELAQRQERIRHMASKLLSQASEIRALHVRVCVAPARSGCVCVRHTGPWGVVRVGVCGRCGDACMWWLLIAFIASRGAGV